MTKEALKPAKRLIVLGNGFDLKCSLKSTFQNFINKDTNSSEQARKLELVYRKSGNSRTRWNIALSNAIGREQGWFSGDVDSEIEQLIADHPDNLWKAILLIRKMSEQTEWYNVEQVIQDIITDSELQNISHMTGNSLNERQFGRLRHTELAFILFLSVHFYGFNLQSDSFIEFLIKQLIQFEDDFKNYLQSNVEERDPVYKISSKNMLDWLAENETSSILNFNYTEPQSILNDQKFDSSRAQNIHGSLRSHPVMGIDQVGLTANQDTFQFTKTFRIMKLANGKVNKSVLSKSIQTIVFFGHSLSKADYSYFQSLFDYFDIYSQPIKLIFGYAAYGDLTDEEVATQEFHRVSSLFQTYGNTLDNKDHGNNLMHKLLLDNRLIIKNYANAEEFEYEPR